VSEPGSDGVPRVADVGAAFARFLADAEERPHDGVLSVLLDLHSNNLTQWNREDAARRPDIDAAALAAAKRDIDRLNAVRHRLMETIDAAIDAAIRQNPLAPLCTDTPAMAYDRLSVLIIRIHFTDRAAAEYPGAAEYAARLPALHRQRDVLEEALHQLFDELQAGRRRFVPYESLKLYQAPRASS
jgi:hypothetical protein